MSPSLPSRTGASLSADCVRAVDATLRGARARAFPPGYFVETAWELLLELDRAVRVGRAFPVSRDCPSTRFLGLLERDGFVECRRDPLNASGEIAVLTALGQIKLDEVFLEAALSI